MDMENITIVQVKFIKDYGKIIKKRIDINNLLS